MTHHPSTRRTYTKMWNPIYFFAIMMMFMMVSQPVFATSEEECELAIQKIAEESKVELPNNKFFSTLNRPDKCTQAQFDKSKRDDICIVAMMFKIEVQTTQMALNTMELKQSMEQTKKTPDRNQIIAPIIAIFSNLEKPQSECDDEQFKRIKEELKCAMAIGIDLALESKQPPKEKSENIAALRNLKKPSECTDKQFAKTKKAMGVTDDQNCCMYFMIIAIIIAIMIGVVIFFSEVDEKEDHNTSADFHI